MQAVLEKAEKYSDKLPEDQKEAAKVYIKTMERILERGDVFAPTKQSGIEGMLRGKLINDKKKLMEKREEIYCSPSSSKMSCNCQKRDRIIIRPLSYKELNAYLLVSQKLRFLSMSNENKGF